MGCHGAINGLRAALAIATADERARVLLVATELCSLHYRFQWDPERLVANALFADATTRFLDASLSPKIFEAMAMLKVGKEAWITDE